VLKSRIARLGIGLVALVGLAIALLAVPAVQDRLFEAGVKRAMHRDPAVMPEEGHLKVVLCGTSAPPPSDVRAKSCTLVLAGKHAFVVDTGPGSANRLSKWRFPMELISGVLLTHFHSDHIGELGEYRMQSWVAGRSKLLPVYGPDGVEELTTGFNQAYAADSRYRAGEHGLDIAVADLEPRPFGLASAEERKAHMGSKVIFEADGLRITAFEVMHEPVYPAVGYRFDYRGRSVVVSGDTAVSANLVRVSKDADVLIHEGQSEEMRQAFAHALEAGGSPRLAKLIGAVGNYHATPAQVAQEANEANVGLLVFSHMGPIAPDNTILRKIFERGIEKVRPRSQWVLGFDGYALDLPVESNEILQGRIE